MATPSEKLAASLESLRDLQERGIIAIRSKQITRVHRERLVKGGFLKEVMRGWYIAARPDETAGESTAWYASFWHFCAEYLNGRFKKGWSISPVQSLKLHVGNRTVPEQLLVRSPKARNQITKLIHDTAILEVRATLPAKEFIVTDSDGMQLYSLPSAIINSHEDFYKRNPTDVRAALSMIRDASELLPILLDGGHSVLACRVAGAFRNIGKDRIADEIVAGMRAAGYTVKEDDPFETRSPIIFPQRERSPYINRIRLMWHEMREPILKVFPPPPGLPKDVSDYMKDVSDAYVKDAYNSLSIEGYRVSTELIDKVRRNEWRPDLDKDDKNQVDAMAARGYWQAFQSVQASLQDILTGKNAGEVVDRDHPKWFQEMFAPSVTAGIIKASHLAGYRNHPVFIRRSMHVPPGEDAVRDLMPVFFELLAEEKEAAIRVVLGHFVFVYIHPYRDGNGRMGRFLMNAMFASGGYPWTVVPLESREKYMRALEHASVGQDIKPFAQFIADLLP